MKFNSNLNIDFGKWANAKMEREVVKVDGKIEEEDMPKYFLSLIDVHFYFNF